MTAVITCLVSGFLSRDVVTDQSDPRVQSRDQISNQSEARVRNTWHNTCTQAQGDDSSHQGDDMLLPNNHRQGFSHVTKSRDKINQSEARILITWPRTTTTLHLKKGVQTIKLYY